MFRGSKSRVDICVVPAKDSTTLTREERGIRVDLDVITNNTIETTCCTATDFAKLWHYMKSAECLSCCEVKIDNGWTSTDFLAFYIRTLQEVILRHQAGNLHKTVNFFNPSELACLKKELEIAINAHQAKKQLDDAVKYKASVYDKSATLNNKKEAGKQLAEKIMSLQAGAHYCYPCGYQTHAMYVNFEKAENIVKAHIFNLGHGSEYHTSNPQFPNQIAPYLREFNKNEGVELLSFCCALTHSTMQPAKDANMVFECIYGNKSSMQFCYVYEFQQTIGNCASEGYFQSIRYRLSKMCASSNSTKNEWLYVKLILSIYAYSLNLFHVIKYNSYINLEELGTQFNSLYQSEAAFQSHQKESLKRILINFNLNYSNNLGILIKQQMGNECSIVQNGQAPNNTTSSNCFIS